MDNIVDLKGFREHKVTKELERKIEEYFLDLEKTGKLPAPKSPLRIKLEVLSELQERLEEELEDLRALQEDLLTAGSALNKRATWKMIKKVTNTLKVIRSNIEVKKKEIISGK